MACEQRAELVTSVKIEKKLTILLSQLSTTILIGSYLLLLIALLQQFNIHDIPNITRFWFWKQEAHSSFLVFFVFDYSVYYNSRRGSSTTTSFSCVSGIHRK